MVSVSIRLVKRIISKKNLLLRLALVTGNISLYSLKWVTVKILLFLKLSLLHRNPVFLLRALIDRSKFTQIVSSEISTVLTKYCTAKRFLILLCDLLVYTSGFGGSLHFKIIDIGFTLYVI